MTQDQQRLERIRAISRRLLHGGVMSRAVMLGLVEINAIVGDAESEWTIDAEEVAV